MSSNSMNRVFLMGHLGQSPALQVSKNGRPYTRLSLATNRRWVQSGADEDSVKEATDWHSVFVWGPLAERCVTSLQKGALVFVEGSLTYWKSEESDAPYKNAIQGHNVRFLNSPRRAMAAANAALAELDDEEPKPDHLDIPTEARNHNAVAHL